MSNLIHLFADVAEKVLDRCTEQREYNYEFLEDFKQIPWSCCRRNKNDDNERQSQHDHWGPKNFDRSNHPLAIMVIYAYICVTLTHYVFCKLEYVCS